MTSCTQWHARGLSGADAHMQNQPRCADSLLGYRMAPWKRRAGHAGLPSSRRSMNDQFLLLWLRPPGSSSSCCHPYNLRMLWLMWGDKQCLPFASLLPRIRFESRNPNPEEAKTKESRFTACKVNMGRPALSLCFCLHFPTPHTEQSDPQADGFCWKRAPGDMNPAQSI